MAPRKRLTAAEAAAAAAQAELGRRLRLARDERGWSREKLSAESGVHPQIIYRYETGRAGWSVPSLIAVARALRFNLNTLKDLDWPLPASNYSD